MIKTAPMKLLRALFSSLVLILPSSASFAVQPLGCWDLHKASQTSEGGETHEIEKTHSERRYALITEICIGRFKVQEQGPEQLQVNLTGKLNGSPVERVFPIQTFGLEEIAEPHRFHRFRGMLEFRKFDGPYEETSIQTVWMEFDLSPGELDAPSAFALELAHDYTPDGGDIHTEYFPYHYRRATRPPGLESGK